MIKHNNGQQYAAPQKPKEPVQVNRPSCDVLTDTHMFKAVGAQPTMAQLEFTLSKIFKEAIGAGFRYVEKFQFSSSEHILVFERIKDNK